MSELDMQLPEEPRTPTWGRCLRKRWPLGAAGITLLILGIAALALDLSASFRDLSLGLAVLPGIGAVMLWIRGVMRLRVLLTSGTATPAIIASRDEDVHYIYHDENGREHRGRVARPSCADSSQFHVVFDPNRPGDHALARRGDFIENGRS